MIINSKSMAVAAAALAMCMAAGSALAQDRRLDDRPGDGRDGRYEQQQNRQFDRRDNRDNRDNRNDWHGRQDFRDGRQFDRGGFPQPHAEWRRGGRVPPEYRSGNYVVNDWRAYRLQPPPRGYQWVGVGGDYVLTAVGTGVIVQIVSGQ